MSLRHLRLKALRAYLLHLFGKGMPGSGLGFSRGLGFEGLGFKGLELRV